MMHRPLASSTPDARGARVLPVLAAVRFGPSGDVRYEEHDDALAGDTLCFADGALELRLERVDQGDAATIGVALRNAGPEPLRVESVDLMLRFCGHGASALRFLRHGWQSWSFTGARDLDDAGEPEFPSGPWLRGMYHCVGAPDIRRTQWHESETFALVGTTDRAPACLVGVLETGSAFGVVYLRPEPAAGGGERAVTLVAELRAEIVLEPGERRVLESVRVAVGSDPGLLLERFAELWGERAGARRAVPFQAGWCSWYHFFHRVSEQDVLRNLDAMAADRTGLPVSLVQIDDGYQRTIGDWLETNEKFPRGLAPVADAIRAAGYRPGIWTAPFAASAESRVLREHPDWVLRDGEHWLRGSLNPEWSEDGWVYCLDTSRDEVLRHLEQVFRELAGMGFTYQKLDFLYMAAMQGRAHDPSRTRAQRLRDGLDAVRRGAGEDAFLLGCGCPLGPAVGVVDGMRIGPDVAPSWEIDHPMVVPGLEPMLPSTRSAIRSILQRVFMHRRLWLNDPDCLMVRTRETKLLPHEARTLADVIAATGGMVVFSDDVDLLGEAERAWVREVVELGREVDLASPRGVARLVEPLARDDSVRELQSDLGRDVLQTTMNLSDASAEASGWAGTKLRAHQSASRRLESARDWAIFCDFDGTFSVQDVGDTLARQRLPERRAELWQRYTAGELDAWRYQEILFADHDFSRDELEAFLATIELDPGAAELVEWCDHEHVPLRILSDGFDHNLDRLQAMHGIRFDYAANHLEFSGDRWRITPGGRNLHCACGTGSCKRAQIDLFRSAHPGAYCVHIGNGRISDLCGALVADLVFAKGTLSDALRERGVFHHGFNSLSDVVVEIGRRRTRSRRWAVAPIPG